MLNGARDFCQEFLTDVRVPDTDRIGEVDGGWTVGTRWMYHERLQSESPYVTVPEKPAISDRSPVEIACRAGTVDEPFGDIGDTFLMRQVSCIGGGTTEMARNVISERVLGMPREARSDHNIPFRDVPRGGRRGTT